jgi:hypothetical protein
VFATPCLITVCSFSMLWKRTSTSRVIVCAGGVCESGVTSEYSYTNILFEGTSKSVFVCFCTRVAFQHSIPMYNVAK